MKKASVIFRLENILILDPLLFLICRLCGQRYTAEQVFTKEVNNLTERERNKINSILCTTLAKLKPGAEAVINQLKAEGHNIMIAYTFNSSTAVFLIDRILKDSSIISFPLTDSPSEVAGKRISPEEAVPFDCTSYGEKGDKDDEFSIILSAVKEISIQVEEPVVEEVAEVVLEVVEEPTVEEVVEVVEEKPKKKRTRRKKKEEPVVEEPVVEEVAEDE